MFFFALLAGEVALGTIAYVVAYELTRTDDPLGRRALSLVPVVILSFAWAVTYKALGYGASGALMYIDPFSQPLDWVKAVLTRGPVLLGALFAGFWGEVWTVTPPDGRAGLIIVSVIATALFLFGLWRASRTMEPHLRRRVAWMSLGAVLSVLPVTSTFPSARLLLVPSLGALVAVALVIQHAWRAKSLRPPGLAAGAGAAVLVLLHVVLAVPQWGFGYALMHFAGQKSDRMHAAVMSQVDVARLSDTRLVTLSSDPLSAMNAGARLSLETGTAPRAWWLLSIAHGEHVFTRPGRSSLEMELAAADKRLLASEAELFLRPPPTPMPERESLPGMRVEVAERDHAGIKRLRFDFDVPLEDPSLILFHFEDRELKRLTPPAVGTRWTEKEPPIL
ncbi:MAG TPA: hypothetical protein VE618_04930 [Myxococcaceae bacterium]|nr:hypothetical protein [Myxococcaceae bacterium]